MTIEPLQPADDSRVADFVLGIQNGEFQLGFAPHEQPDLLNLSRFYADGGFWVAKVGEELVGTIGLQRLNEQTAILRKLFVKRELRGATPKVAQQLFDRLLPVAKQLGFGTIYLDTPTVASASHRFYERNGFVEVTRNCQLAQQLSQHLAASAQFSLLAPTRLNVVCFTFRASGAQSAGTLQRLQQWLRNDGRAFFTPTVLQGRPGLRAAFSNWRTEAADVALAWQALQEGAAWVLENENV